MIARKTSLKRSKSTLKRKPFSAKVATSKKVKKPKTVTKLKKELDTLFSKYIRAEFPAECYTCGFKGQMQCGHFISRMYLKTRWEKDNCRPQCMMCNIWGKGMPIDFEERLKKDLGTERVEEMKSVRKEITKLNREWLEEQIVFYKSFTVKQNNRQD